MLRITIVTAALLLASGAMAQQMTAAQRDACKGDFEKFCKGTQPGWRADHRLPRQAE